MSRILLDTHVFLWWRKADPRLGAGVVEAVGAADLVYVSAASAWEAQIKSSLGRLDLPRAFADEVASADFEELPVTFAHAAATSKLPRHHGDPFARLLVAQAIVEDLRLVTHDRALRSYPVDLLLV